MKGKLIIVNFVGSVGSGKTTLSKKLYRYFKQRTISYYVDICVFHGLSYFILYILFALLLKIRRIKFVGNYYLTIWFNHRDYFTRNLKILLLFDVFSIYMITLLKFSIRVVMCRITKKTCIIFVDEGPLTSIGIQFYFSRFIDSIKPTLNLYYKFLFALLYKQYFKYDSIVIILKKELIQSIRSWIKREKNQIIDKDFINVRLIIEKLLINSIEGRRNIKILEFTVKNNWELPKYANFVSKLLIDSIEYE